MELIRINKSISKKSTTPHWDIVNVEDNYISNCPIVRWDINVVISETDDAVNIEWGAYDYYFVKNTPRMMEIVQHLDSIELGTMHYWEEDHHGEYDAGTRLEWDCGLARWGCLLEIHPAPDIESMSNKDIVAALIRFSNDCEYTCWSGTREDWTERESERERKELESAAAAFASECGHAVGTPAYVHAIHRAIAGAFDDYDEDRSGERKMERWAAHQYCGTTSSYWEDEDYINGRHMSRIDGLQMVLTWLTNNCPLLMLKIEEQRQSNPELVEA